MEEKYRIKYLYSVIKPVFEEWCEKSPFITGAWTTGRTDIEPEAQGSYWDFQRMHAWKQFTTLLDQRLAGRTLEQEDAEPAYTLKELYALVDEYYKQEGQYYNPAVGDFVDWVASQDRAETGVQIHLDTENMQRLVDGLNETGRLANKPVLPEKLEPVYKKEKRYQPGQTLPAITVMDMGPPKDVLDVQATVLKIIDYLNRRDQ